MVVVARHRSGEAHMMQGARVYPVVSAVCSHWTLLSRCRVFHTCAANGRGPHSTYDLLKF